MKKAGYILIATIAIFAACNLLSTAAFAGSTVKFAWDANSEPDLAGYRLFQRVEGGSYDYSAPVWEGVEVGCSLGNVPDGTYFWVLRAFDTNENESGDSNEVSAVLDATAPKVPTIEISVIIKLRGL